MNAELEALVLALDTVVEARGGNQAENLQARYEAKLEEVLARFPGLSRDRLVRAVDFAHRQWKHTQDKRRTSIPPRA